MAGNDLYQELYLHQLGNLVRVQAYEEGRPTGQALTFELKNCAIGQSEASKPLIEEKGAKRIYGIIGLQQLLGGSALAVITGVKEVCSASKKAHFTFHGHHHVKHEAAYIYAQVAVLRGHPVYAVASSHIIVNDDCHMDDERSTPLPVHCPCSSMQQETCPHRWRASQGLHFML